MAGEIILGPTKPSLKRDTDGHRNYTISYKVKTTDVSEGPLGILLTPGLPVPGAIWNLGTDLDPWAYCKWNVSVSPVLSDESSPVWMIEFTFSTKPDKRCQNVPVDNPLMEPIKVSVSSQKYQEEASYDRFGQQIVNSAFEPFKGAQVEFDAGRFSVSIEMNVPLLDLGFLRLFQDSVNDSELWGMPARCVKFTSFKATKKWYGPCGIYWTLSMEFDARDDTFDRKLRDEGTKVLKGHWSSNKGNWVLDNVGGSPPDPTNPTHFIAATDWYGNPMNVILNGHGIPSGVVVGESSSVSSVFIADGGTDYHVGDLLTLSAGTFSVSAQFTVTSVDNFGAITGLSVTVGGVYTIPPQNPLVDPTDMNNNNIGADAVISVTWASVKTKVASVSSVVTGGTNYKVGDILFIDGGTFSAQAELTVSSIGGSGAVTGATVSQAGGYTTQPSNPVSIGGGLGVGGVVGGLIGSGATFNLTWTNAAGDLEQPGKITVQKYQEVNLLLLGLPNDLNTLF